MKNLSTDEGSVKPALSPEDVRKRYESFMEQVLGEWGSKINDLDSRLVRERRETEAEMVNLEYLNSLRTKSQDATLLFEELKKSSKDWDTKSKNLDKWIEELKLDFERAQNIIR